MKHLVPFYEARPQHRPLGGKHDRADDIHDQTPRQQPQALPPCDTDKFEEPRCRHPADGQVNVYKNLSSHLEKPKRKEVCGQPCDTKSG